MTVKIKAKKRLTQAMPQLVPESRTYEMVRSLEDSYLGEDAYEELGPYNGRYWKAFTIDGKIVYCRNNGNGYKFVCFDNNKPGLSSRITFTSELDPVTPRGDLYKKGLCQSLVIKDKTSIATKDFALKFAINLFSYHYIDSFLASDLVLSSFGADLWEKMLKYFVQHGYRCYYSFSAPGQTCFMVQLLDPKDAMYYKRYMMGKSTGYRTRSVIIVQKNVKPSTICSTSRELYWTNCAFAEYAGVFKKPVKDLSDEEFDIYSRNLLK